MAVGLNTRSWRRRLGAVLLVLGVTLAHWLVTQEVAESRIGSGAADAAMPPRLEVAFVHELAPAAPPPAPAPAAVKPVRRKKPAAVAAAASAPAKAASAAQAAASADDVPAYTEPEVTALAEPAASAPAVPASAGEPAVAAAVPAPPASQAAPPFEWPPSTRVNYRVSGYWRGPIEGDARVQWVRAGQRYQVHLDFNLALVASRRMTSDGELTDDGLKPRRYDEETRVLFQAPRLATLHFEPGRIVTATGSVRDTMPGVQDTASQFVQLAWLFNTQPQQLRVGNTIELPLALPRSSKVVMLDVLGEEQLDTPIGSLQTYYLKPRREVKPSGDITADIWIAPGLQYLPVRIRLQLGEAVADLNIAARPLQAER
jgi:hypothetical protein